jgi:sRNA-binding regulator protein Hfq
MSEKTTAIKEYFEHLSRSLRIAAIYLVNGIFPSVWIGKADQLVLNTKTRRHLLRSIGVS